MATSPYAGAPILHWSQITHDLISQYPISHQEILDIAMLSWDRLWSSQIGEEISLDELELPATVVGYFFQKLFAHELKSRYPYMWKGEKIKSDKDLVNIQNPYFSTEMKSSGQLGYSIFGNRSYNQVAESLSMSGKDKSGFYITMNFYQKNMTLLRVGWIDQDDWIPQGAATGQAAVLRQEVYLHKLQVINGPYRNASPIELLSGIGPASVTQFHYEGIYTFGDLKSYSGNTPIIRRALDKHYSFLHSF